MPELPEVEVLVQHLRPLLCGRRIRSVRVHRARVVRPTDPVTFARALVGRRIEGVDRRAKYLVIRLHSRRGGSGLLLGHLGMTGRLYLLPAGRPLPRHTAVVLQFDRGRLVYEDPRYFGRLTLDASPLERLGPEPLERGFTLEVLAAALSRSAQPIKVRLLDQSVVAGVGNIYASEALFVARIAPERPSNRLNLGQLRALRRALRQVLRSAIRAGSTVPLHWSGTDRGDGFFYYGRAEGAAADYEERLRVYDRANLPCGRCGAAIRRTVQGGRSTYACPACQRG